MHAHVSGFDVSYGDSACPRKFWLILRNTILGTWTILPRDPYPIELAAFSASPIQSGVKCAGLRV
jgi:hypothetical protein